MNTEAKERCPHDVADLLNREGTFSQSSETGGFAWCRDCRVWVQFAVPQGTFERNRT